MILFNHKIRLKRMIKEIHVRTQWFHLSSPDSYRDSAKCAAAENLQTDERDHCTS